MTKHDEINHSKRTMKQELDVESSSRMFGNPPFYDKGLAVHPRAKQAPWNDFPTGVPAIEAEVFWVDPGEAAGPGWHPYVIECVSINEPYLRFKFQQVSPGQAGYHFHGDEHVIDLNDRRLVWRSLPSTLEGIKAGQHAFLFLSEDLWTIAPALARDGGDPRKKAGGPGTGGSGKWPPLGGSRSPVLTHPTIDQLHNLVAAATAALETIDEEHRPTLEAALEPFRGAR